MRFDDNFFRQCLWLAVFLLVVILIYNDVDLSPWWQILVFASVIIGLVRIVWSPKSRSADFIFLYVLVLVLVIFLLIFFAKKISIW